jgi:hypothetical protein
MAGRALRRLVLGLAKLCAVLLAALLLLGTAIGVVATAAPGGWLRAVVVIVCAVYLGVVVHELGHFLAARLCGAPVVAIEIGGPPYLADVRIGGTQLRLGIRPRGQVRYTGSPGVGRSAVIVAAGPLVTLLAAALILAVPVAMWLTRSAALVIGCVGAAELIPFASRGHVSDGARLLALPIRHAAEKDVRRLTAEPDWRERPDAADRLLVAYRRRAVQARGRPDVLAVLLQERGRTDELLALHQQPLRMDDTPSRAAVQALLTLEWAVVTVPGLSRPAADLAARRITWALSHLRNSADHDGAHVLAAEHSLAVARLRQRRFAEVEPLCAAALAAATLPADQRATVLATVAMARHALGQDFRAPLDQALALDPDAELVGEAQALAPDLAAPAEASSPAG